MWAGLKWFIKDSIALTACIIVDKGTKGEGKNKGKVPVRDPHSAHLGQG